MTRIVEDKAAFTGTKEFIKDLLNKDKKTVKMIIGLLVVIVD